MISLLEYFISYQKRIQYAIEAVRILEKFVARKPEKEVISMRIPLDTLKKVDSKAASVGISRNELINQMIQYALSNMEDITEEDS
jgi:predicted DNA binding CopG/RHH family protein